MSDMNYEATIVYTKKGKISGVIEEKSYVYKGISFAKPPVGNLRWKAPQETESWDGVYEADFFRNKCMQAEPTEDEKKGLYWKEFFVDQRYDRKPDEDCLYLNIWKPARRYEEKLPVAFWIHGGGYLGGYGSDIVLDGKALNEKGVILVAIQYRLGVYGFLAHPWLDTENERHISGNYGILDQIAALKWVYDHIDCFGGDPGNITVFGQSAGAMSVQTLISSPLTENMIAKAILQSGGSYGKGLIQDIGHEQALSYGEKITGLAGVHNLEELRNLSAEALQEAQDIFMKEAFASGWGFALSPNIDGYVLEQGYNETIEKNLIKDIPYMLGCTKHDILADPEAVKKGEKGELYEGGIRFSHMTEKLQQRPAYVYYFTRNLPGDMAGAFHSSELWYVFGTLDRCWRPFSSADHKLSAQIVTFWTNFMKYADPNGQGDILWRPCKKTDDFVMELNCGSTISV